MKSDIYFFKIQKNKSPGACRVSWPYGRVENAMNYLLQT